jgi:hypothetical protein
MPLAELAGRAGTLPPAHIVVAVPKLKAGVIFGFTVTVKLFGTAHCPEPGVKIYVPDAWLFITAGLQEPAMPLPDVAGRAGTVPPAQTIIDVPKVKTGVIFGLTVTVKITGGAQVPGVGVKV